METLTIDDIEKELRSYGERPPPRNAWIDLADRLHQAKKEMKLASNVVVYDKELYYRRNREDGYTTTSSNCNFAKVRPFVLNAIGTLTAAQDVKCECHACGYKRKVAAELAEALGTMPRRCDKIEDRHSALYLFVDYIQGLEGRKLTEAEWLAAREAIFFLYYDGEDAR